GHHKPWFRQRLAPAAPGRGALALTLGAARCYNPAVASKTCPRARRSPMRRRPAPAVVTALAVVLSVTVAAVHGQPPSAWYRIGFIAMQLATRFNIKVNALKLAFLSEDCSYGQGVTESARQRAKAEFGMQDVAVEYYSFTSINDFTPIITKFKQLNPDVVHHIGYTNDAPLFWRQAREQTFLFKALVHAGATGYGSPDFGRALGGDANGVFALLEPGPGFCLEALRPDGQKLDRELREAVQKRTGSYPLGGHQLARGGLWLLKVVLDRAKSDDLDK